MWRAKAPSADQPRCCRQLHQGHHQGHRHRNRGARSHGAVRCIPRGRVRCGGEDIGCDGGTIGEVGENIQYYGILDVANPANLVGLVIGAAVVFLFSGLAINAVSRAAGAVIFEVRRQFREIPGIMEGTTKPEYGKVVDIVTRDSLRELVTPGLLAVLTPIAVGFGLGVGALGAYLAGTIATGVLMAVFLSNSGGAWDNAKKFVEDGHFGGKNSEAHSATVIGDTVGDPFKDTAGPAINPLIKVMNLVALLVAPAVVTLEHRRWGQPHHSLGDRPCGHRDRGCRGGHLQAPTDRSGRPRGGQRLSATFRYSDNRPGASFPVGECPGRFAARGRCAVDNRWCPTVRLRCPPWPPCPQDRRH